MLEEMRVPLAEKGIGLEFDRSALQAIAAEAFGKKYGAREIRHVIRDRIEDIIAFEIIDKSAKLECISVTAEDNVVRTTFDYQK